MGAPGTTPGPWFMRLEAVRTVIYRKGEIGEQALAVGAGHYPDHIANAHQIAASGALYDAAALAEMALTDYRAGIAKGYPEAALTALRAALALARGESPHV